MPNLLKTSSKCGFLQYLSVSKTNAKSKYCFSKVCYAFEGRVPIVELVFTKRLSNEYQENYRDNMENDALCLLESEGKSQSWRDFRIYHN